MPPVPHQQRLHLGRNGLSGQCYVVSFDISDDEVVPSPVELARREVRVVPVCGGYLAIGAVLNTLYSHPVGDDEGIFQIRRRPFGIRTCVSDLIILCWRIRRDNMVIQHDRQPVEGAGSLFDFLRWSVSPVFLLRV